MSKTGPKALGTTERIRPVFNFGTLNGEQRKMHEKIASSWNEVCEQQASLGRNLIAMHATFSKAGVVKKGGPGSRWQQYLTAVGIPKSTARDYMHLAKERADAGIPERAEKHLASVGVSLDKPSMTNALLTPELRQKVAAIKSVEDAEALKPLILEIARTPQPKAEADKPAGAEAVNSTIDRGKAIVSVIHYLSTFKGEELEAKFAELVEEIRQQVLPEESKEDETEDVENETETKEAAV